MEAIREIHRRVRGSYAVLFIDERGMIAFQDPYSIRPLVFGKKHDGSAVMFASETVALEKIGYEFCANVAAGEVVFADQKGNINFKRIGYYDPRPCIFEYIYFAHPRSVVNGVPVDWARRRMGYMLAKKIEGLAWYKKIDVVVPVPKTSFIAAEILAAKINKPFVRALKRSNKGRTFFINGHDDREMTVKSKFKVSTRAVAGKFVLLVDDYIMRGTTAKIIVQDLFENGAVAVYFASVAPKIRYPNIYGINTPRAEELICNWYSSDAILSAALSIKGIAFLDLDDIFVALDAHEYNQYETSMFCGEHPSYIEALPKPILYYHARLNMQVSKNAALAWKAARESKVKNNQHQCLLQQ